jgi:hypothetical protein
VSEDREAMRRAHAARQAHAGMLLAKANVVGVGVGLRQRGGHKTPEVALVVMVRRKVPVTQLAETDRIPAEIDGVPVDVQEVGDVTAQGAA